VLAGVFGDQPSGSDEFLESVKPLRSHSCPSATGPTTPLACWVRSRLRTATACSSRSR
jgi:hypothetical protein